jgi:hypothetical protein
MGRKLIAGLIGAALLGAAPAAAEQVTFTSPVEALKQGMSAFTGGYYEIAVPALEQAMAGDDLLASYFLARIYADNSGSQTDHAKAYALYRRIADEHADIDPEDDRRAPYVGKALTALAGYVLRGLPEIALRPNPELAADYLYNASATFDDEDAQFELAKLQLKGEGVEQDVANAKHWLATLSRKGHAGAQAFLADLLWRGSHMTADPGRALALISVAVANAPAQDRLWIEDIYQNIYCGAGEGIRKQATGIVAEWGNRFAGPRRPDMTDRSGLGPLTAQPVRTCQNGEPVGTITTEAGAAGVTVDPLSATPSDRRFLRGGTAPALRDIRAPGR